MATNDLLLVTGGAGFIGANFVHKVLGASGSGVVNLDKLTYAGNIRNLDALKGNPRHVFVRGDICDRALLERLFAEHRPRAVVNFAAETHVDRSILGPAEFVQTNVMGTFCLLEEARAYWETLPPAERSRFRFLHISTDEVFGSLAPADAPFRETNAYAPNSPYAASKAGADHLVRAYHQTYGLPTLTTNCSNNYGPYQYPEKLIPLMIRKALAGEPLPLYGDGRNIRDWLYVLDHCEALDLVLEQGIPGHTYNIGGHGERTNLEVVEALCSLLDGACPRAGGRYRDQITFVKDRPGHDRRYAIDATKMQSELGWRPKESFESGLAKTVAWYLANHAMSEATAGTYGSWMELNYAGRGAA